MRSVQDLALDFANKLRTQLGEETLMVLPLGVQNEPEACPLARAFNFDFHVDGKWAASPNYNHALALHQLAPDSTLDLDSDYGWKVNDLPGFLADFVVDFDNGNYPELIEDYEDYEETEYDDEDDEDPYW